jgi:hypothetical protein
VYGCGLLWVEDLGTGNCISTYNLIFVEFAWRDWFFTIDKGLTLTPPAVVPANSADTILDRRLLTNAKKL